MDNNIKSSEEDENMVQPIANINNGSEEEDKVLED